MDKTGLKILKGCAQTRDSMGSQKEYLRPCQELVITFVLDGLPKLVKWEGQIDDVQFRIHESAIDKDEKLMASVVVKGTDLALIRAQEQIDTALSSLSFAFGYPVKRSSERYTRVLEPEPDMPLYGWGFHRVITEGEAVALVDWNEIMDHHQSKVANLTPEKRAVFIRATAFYREAIGIENPLIATVVYFMAGSVIALEMCSKRDRYGNLSSAELKAAYKTVAANTEDAKFQELIERFYGNDNGRCGVDHGHVNVIDPLSVGNATVLLGLLRGWTRDLIRKFLDDNQPPPQR